MEGPTMTMKTITAIAILALMLASGCGSVGQKGQTRHDVRADVAQAYNEWNQLVADGQYQEACSRLTPAAIREAEAAFDAHSKCAPVLALAVAEDAESFTMEAQATDVRLQGKTAVVRVLKRGDGPTHMRQVHGRWLIDADSPAETKTTPAKAATPKPSPAPRKRRASKPAASVNVCAVPGASSV